MKHTRCIHHWRLPTPDGPVAHARCGLCGAERAMPNVFVAGRELVLHSPKSPARRAGEGVAGVERQQARVAICPDCGRMLNNSNIARHLKAHACRGEE